MADDDRFSRGGIGWVQPPADSHLWGFRLYDADEHGLAQSQLFVRFKGKGGAGIGAEYFYYLDAAEGRDVYESMAAAESPGTVLHARVIGRGNRGHKVA